MKACEYCGRENHDLFVHCRECGTELSAESLRSPGVWQDSEADDVESASRIPSETFGKSAISAGALFHLILLVVHVLAKLIHD